MTYDGINIRPICVDDASLDRSTEFMTQLAKLARGQWSHSSTMTVMPISSLPTLFVWTTFDQSL